MTSASRVRAARSEKLKSEGVLRAVALLAPADLDFIGTWADSLPMTGEIAGAELVSVLRLFREILVEQPQLRDRIKIRRARSVDSPKSGVPRNQR